MSLAENYLDVALAYAKAGVRVFPCDPQTKRPLTRKGFHDASTDRQKVKRWWTRHPSALIAGVCGEKFVVLDVDFKNGAKAYESMSYLHDYVAHCSDRTTTLSMGAHYYFAPDSDLKRKIGFVPSVDLLGEGGYVILPDGKRYLQTGSLKKFIEKIATKGLSRFPKAVRNHILGTEELPVLAKLKAASQVKKTPSLPSQEAPKIDEEGEKETAVRSAIEEKKSVEGERIYEKSDKFKATEWNYTGEPLKVGPNSLNTADMNGLFHNKSIQKRLATFMGIPVPNGHEGRTGSFKSVLPGHTDNKPSMGARWVGKGDSAHLVVRDFSDFFGDGKSDYNLVRLYAAKHYKESMAHLTGTLWCVWFMRLLDEAGVIEIQYPEFENEGYRLTTSERKVSDGFLKLMAYKMARSETEFETTFSQKFAAAWCGVSQAIVNSAKGKMIRFGNVIKTGLYHGVGMMRTAILRLGEGIVLRSELKSISELNFAVKLMLRKKAARGEGQPWWSLGKNNVVNKDNISDDEIKDNAKDTTDPPPKPKPKRRKSFDIGSFYSVWDGSPS